LLLIASLQPRRDAGAGWTRRKDQSIARLAASHDPEIPIAIGRAVIKQAVAEGDSAMLADAISQTAAWAGLEAFRAEWQAAEGQLPSSVDAWIARLTTLAWFRVDWRRGRQRAERRKADEIVNTFCDEGACEQGSCRPAADR